MFICIEYEELQQVASSNQRRDDRLSKVRGKHFTEKLKKIQVMSKKGGGWRGDDIELFIIERVYGSEKRVRN